MLFIIALILFVQTQHYILITTTAEIEAIIHKLRVRLMDYVRRSELLPLEMIGRAKGATLAEIMKATEWQAHSVRGFISTAGKKQGIKIESAKSEAGERTYKIAK